VDTENDTLYRAAPAFIAEWVSGLDLHQTIGGENAAAAAHTDVTYPGSGQIVASAPAGDAATVDAAVRSAHTAFEGWARTPWAARQAALQHFADLVEADADTLSYLVTSETGRPLRKALSEVMGAVRYIRTVASVEPAVSSIAHPTSRIRLAQRPLGVVAAIAPWNGPVILAVVKIATALIAGNTCVLKPSPFSPLSALRFGTLAREAFPPGVCNIVAGDGDVGAALVSHPLVAKISFTGSTATGRMIAASAGANLKRVTLELGGNDAAIVLGDADLGRFVEFATQISLANCGAFCAGIKRVYVERSIHDELVERFAARISTITLGDGFDPATEMGPIQNLPQYERVLGFRDDAITSGGTVHGDVALVPESGWFIAPSVVTGLEADHRLVVDEQFGPILPILPIDSIDDALAMANAGPYGLGGSIWSGDIERAVSYAERLDVGSAWVNQHGAFDAAVPMPLAKDSGIGIDYGDFGVAEHSQATLLNVAAS
jgi:acyl-CoA reductase-like NAD-dependent aldehyde dehydrogenase